MHNPLRVFLFEVFFIGSLCTITGFAGGCAVVSQRQALRGVEVGMDKGEVLEKVGNPHHKDRQHGQDRWTYDAETADGRKESIQVFFADGKVTYVGPATKSADPSIQQKSAPTQDASKFKAVGE